MQLGYVDTGTNYDDNEEARQQAYEIFVMQRPFGEFRVGDLNASDQLRPTNSDNPDEFRDKNCIFTLTANAHIFNGAAPIVELKAGDQIAFAINPSIGASKPWNIAFVEKKIVGGQWEPALAGTGTAWIDTRLPYGDSPSKRLLV